jgi:predicted metalloprotease
VRFNPKARLDRSRVRDTRGGGGGLSGGPGGRGGRGGGARLPIPTGKLGLGSLLLVAVVVAVGIFAPNLLGPILGGGTAYSPTRMSDAEDSGRYDHCETGADANDDHDCARVAVENSLTDFWESQLDDFRPISTLTTFSGSVSTACGGATSAVGPFYCPADEGVYLDTTFFDAVLEDQLGGPDGGFVEFYVIAHEYGHHISNITGDMAKVTRQETGPQSLPTRLELQADCYAGMWAHHATTTEDESGEVLIVELTQDDVRLALEAAAAVGDDRIQQRTQGRTDPESWNHGSAEQRMHWFTVGYEQGSMAACDTFSADRV